MLTKCAVLRLLFHIIPHDGSVRLQSTFFYTSSVASPRTFPVYARNPSCLVTSCLSALRVLRFTRDKPFVAGTWRSRRRSQTCPQDFHEADASVVAACGEFKVSSDEVRAVTLRRRNSKVSQGHFVCLCHSQPLKKNTCIYFIIITLIECHFFTRICGLSKEPVALSSSCSLRFDTISLFILVHVPTSYGLVY